MSGPYTNDAIDEAEIRALIESWSSALYNMDSDGLVRDYSDDARVFDVGTQLRRKQDVKELWESCSSYFGDAK